MLRRSRAREVALQLLFQLDHNPGVERAAVDQFVQNRLREPSLRTFCMALYEGVVASSDIIDEKLQAAAENWRLARMTTVDRNVLRLGAFELLFQTAETPPPVAIDEAITLARRFGSADSPAFVNGVLDRVLHSASTAQPAVATPGDSASNQSAPSDTM